MEKREKMSIGEKEEVESHCTSEGSAVADSCALTE
jgi:hypothetical protein